MSPRLDGLASALAKAHAEFVVRLRASRGALEDLGTSGPCPQREERVIRLLRLLDVSRGALLGAHERLLDESHGRGLSRAIRATALVAHVNALVEPLFAHRALRHTLNGRRP